jgi:hypothetical protein
MRKAATETAVCLIVVMFCSSRLIGGVTDQLAKRDFDPDGSAWVETPVPGNALMSAIGGYR